MAKTRLPYPPEFRQQLVDLVLAGRSPEDLAKEFEPSAVTIRNWVAQAKCDGLKSPSDLSLSEHDEVIRLWRENKRHRVEREILSKVAVWFARETNSIPDKSSNS